MRFSILRALFGFGGALVMLLPTPADAQFVRRHYGAGVHIRAPFVRVTVGPYGGASVRAPFVAVDPGSVRVGFRQRLAPVPLYAVPPQYVMSPEYAGPSVGETVVTEGAVQGAVETYQFPSAAELSAMDDASLLAALRELTSRFDARLARLKTGAGWQRYLRLSEPALSDPGANLDPLQRALARFDAVADNPEYAKIAGLPSFIATKAALRQVVMRFDGPQMVDPFGGDSTPREDEPADGEILPTPKPAAEPEAIRGERSVLKRAARD